MRVTYKWFIASTGYEPDEGDLERANCKQAGTLCHEMCGWDCELNLPRWHVRSVIRRFRLNGGVP